MQKYEAYIFDVQGTLFDFFTPVADALRPWVPHHAVGDVVRAWRGDYFERTAGTTQSAEQWNPVQDAYAAGLEALARELGFDIPDPASVAEAWQHLVPWPDVPAGLRRLRTTSVVASLSNTDMSTMVRLFKRTALQWDAVLTAEVFGAFKPAPFLYERTCRYLGVEPASAAMVASHPYDLRAAREVGLNTVFVYRPTEFGDPAYSVDNVSGEFDHRIEDIRELG